MNKEITTIITKILSGEASDSDKQVLLQWFRENEANLHHFGQIESIWNALEILKNSDSFHNERAYSSFQQKIDTKPLVSQTQSRKLPIIDYILRIAAILVIAIILPFSGYVFFSGKNHTDQIRKFEMVTTKGSRSLVTLPDGTRIWLNAESRLTYPERFEGKTREVFLEGEGYFSVSKDKNHPFIVQTSDLSIKVLGTTFNVKSYSSENIIQTTLVEGSVTIERNRKGSDKSEIIKMKPNQQVTFVRNVGVSSISAAQKVSPEKAKTISSNMASKQVIFTDTLNTESFTAWKDDKFLFDNESFNTISKKLERRFGVQIHLMDKDIEKFRFSGRFDQISIEQALAALQFASPFNYHIEKEHIYVGSQRNNSVKSSINK